MYIPRSFPPVVTSISPIPLAWMETGPLLDGDRLFTPSQESAQPHLMMTEIYPFTKATKIVFL